MVDFHEKCLKTNKNVRIWKTKIIDKKTKYIVQLNSNGFESNKKIHEISWYFVQ